MLTSLTLGLFGSLGHCVGMCSAVIIILDRQNSFQGNTFSWVLAHLGRLTTYTLLGLIFGLLGESIWIFSSELPIIQGILSILFGIIAFYMAFAFLGLVKSPEMLFSGIISKWGQVMRWLPACNL